MSEIFHMTSLITKLFSSTTIPFASTAVGEDHQDIDMLHHCPTTNLSWQEFPVHHISANYNDLSRGHLKWGWKSKGISPKVPLIQV